MSKASCELAENEFFSTFHLSCTRTNQRTCCGSLPGFRQKSRKLVESVSQTCTNLSKTWPQSWSKTRFATLQLGLLLARIMECGLYSTQGRAVGTSAGWVCDDHLEWSLRWVKASSSRDGYRRTRDDVELTRRASRGGVIVRPRRVTVPLGRSPSTTGGPPVSQLLKSGRVSSSSDRSRRLMRYPAAGIWASGLKTLAPLDFAWPLEFWINSAASY